MKKKTLCELDWELSQVIHAYIEECGSVRYARNFIDAVLYNERQLETVLRMVFPR